MSRAVNMKWRGVEYTIPATKAFEVGSEIEDIIPFTALMKWGNSPHMHKLAKCYATMLRHAGCKVADVTVFDAMMGRGDASDNASDLGAAAVMALVQILTGDSAGSGDEPGETSAS